MRQRLLYTLILLVAAVSAKAEWSDYSEEQPVIFGVAIDSPPLEYSGRGGEPSGYDTEFVDKLMERLHLPHKNEAMPWADIPRATIDGKINLSLMTFSPYRKDSLHYSRAIFRMYYQIVYRSDRTSRHVDMRRLTGKKVAYLSSRPISDTLAAVGAVPVIVTNLRQAIQDLSDGEYDAVLCYRYQARYIVDTYDFTNLSLEDFTLMPREYCFASRDSALINLINAEIDKMEEEGVIRDVYGPAGLFLDIQKTPRWVWYLLTAITFIVLCVFIILQRRYQVRLKEEMRRAQRSERAKTVFLANVNHVLRTPLNSIIGFSEVLKSNGNDGLPLEERKRLATLVNENGERLLYFINQLLTLTDIETREMKLNRTEVNIDIAMESYAEEARKHLHEGVTLEVVGAEFRSIYADEQVMHTITKNFLDNAVRYTEKGKITLTYRLESNNLYVEVKDTGSGVPEDLRNNIFSLLNDKSTAVQNDIPGLGLTICKTIVEHCQGDIGLVTPPEGGACFWYWVPVRELNK